VCLRVLRFMHACIFLKGMDKGAYSVLYASQASIGKVAYLVPRGLGGSSTNFTDA